MGIDLHEKSAELLEKLANSIYDRNPNNPEPLFFSVKEIHIVEKFIKEITKNIESGEKNDLLSR